LDNDELLVTEGKPATGTGTEEVRFPRLLRPRGPVAGPIKGKEVKGEKGVHEEAARG
jgi:hypothetical protein